MKFNFKGKIFNTQVWNPGIGIVGDIVSFDSETENIKTGKVPGFVLGTAHSGGDAVYLITLKHLNSFLNCHNDKILIMHNAPFDIAVAENEVSFDFDGQIRGNRLFDTGILYRLVNLAEEGQSNTPWSLDRLSSKLLGIDISKDDHLRLDWGRFREGKNVRYLDIPEEKLKYAVIDAIATYEIFLILNDKMKDYKNFLSHKIQLMGAVALNNISRLGIGLDKNRIDNALLQLEEDLKEESEKLGSWGYFPGTEGVTKKFEEIIQSSYIELPRTLTGKISSKKEDLHVHRGQSPFINSYLKFKELSHLKNTLGKFTGDRIHTSFNYLLNTGRTSSSNPNIQNLPRKSGLRECFIPAPGHCFLIIDYKMLELCILAQICFERYRYSKMRDLINQGKDLHLYTAAMLTGKKEDELTKQDRNSAKACNFGFPGGLGIGSFIDFAKENYGLIFSEEDARAFKTKWLDAFPEMREYLKDPLLDRYDFQSQFKENAGMGASVFKRIIGGGSLTKEGKPYNKQTLDWVFTKALPEISPSDVGISYGSPELLERILKVPIEIKTGRIRANCGYCESKNTPFQGLASDGAKIALYRLIKAGFRVVNFIHDEVILEIPLEANLKNVGEEVNKIMVGAMKTVVPDVDISTNSFFADRWYKSGDLIKDENGEIRIYSEDKPFKGPSIVGTINNKRPYTFIDVFSGCGGFSNGLEQAGMKCILGIDSNQDAIESFKLNHKDAKTYCGDIKDLTEAKLLELIGREAVDFVIGGPPCQGFSTAGKGIVEDPRNYLFLEFVRIVKLINPMAIVIENVKGLKAEKNKKILSQIFKIFEELGYEVKAKELLACEFGVPQKRKRVFIVGTKKGHKFTFPKPTHGGSEGLPFATVEDAFKSISEDSSSNNKDTGEISDPLDRERLKYIPQGCGIRKKDHEEKYLPIELRYDADWENLPENRFREVRLQRLSLVSQSPTIRTSKKTYYHPIEDRHLTPREAASIQSFPSDFEFNGCVGSVWTQIGNAVPPVLAKAIGQSLISSLEGIRPIHQINYNPNDQGAEYELTG